MSTWTLLSKFVYLLEWNVFEDAMYHWAIFELPRHAQLRQKVKAQLQSSVKAAKPCSLEQGHLYPEEF